MDWNNGWSWMWMGLMMILFWGGLIVLVALLVRVGRSAAERTRRTRRHVDRIRPRSSGRASPEERSTEDEYRKSLTVLDETKR